MPASARRKATGVLKSKSLVCMEGFVLQGWVVRPGADYGADFVLYEGHPCEVHSSYCILVLTGSKRPEVLRWTDIEAASRVCSEVLMLARPSACQ